MNIEIGKRIKELRKLKGLTQHQLADGICTQAMISHFEKGESIPSSHILFQIALRLDVDMNSFFFGFKPSTILSKDTQQIQQLVRQLTDERNFSAVAIIVEKNLHTAESLKPEELAFLYWHKGICEWEIHHQKEDALNSLHYALTFPLTEGNPLPISIYNSMAIIYFNEKQYSQALITYENCLDLIKNSTEVEANTVKKIYFGLSRVHLYCENFEDSLIYCESAIQLALQKESLYMLGELLFQKGRIFMKAKDYYQGKFILNQAKVIFELEGKVHNIPVINKLLKSAESITS